MIHDPEILHGLPQVHDVQMLWYSEWYDGPVDGLAEYGGRQYWFADVDDYQHSWPERRYVLHPISSEQAAREWTWHREYRMRTGGPGCCHEPTCSGPLDGTADWEGWWHDHPEPVASNYVTIPPVGWFARSG
jgi:hypothetical protein